MPLSQLPDWFVLPDMPLHCDFTSRVVSLACERPWLESKLAGVKMRFMEYVPGPRTRLAMQVQIDRSHAPIILQDHPDLELLMQKGMLDFDAEKFLENWYYRFPSLSNEPHPNLALQCEHSADTQDPVLLYLAVGQMQHSDTQWRKVDAGDDANWFPGPVEGTDVLPLHGHGSENVMMIRWNKTTVFKTRIDPLGEELLIVKGAVCDAQGSYPENTWIRNPVEAWQSWGAKAGTVVYYKNGHFAQS